MVHQSAFPSLVFISVYRLSNRSIEEEIDAPALGTVRTDVAATAAIFAAFVNALVIAVAIAAVMDAMNGCMRLAKATDESSTAWFTYASKSSVPGLIASGLADGGCLLQPLIFFLSSWRS